MLFKKDIWPAGVFLVVMGVYFSVGDFVAGTSLSLRQSAKKSDALKVWQFWPTVVVCAAEPVLSKCRMRSH